MIGDPSLVTDAKEDTLEFDSDRLCALDDDTDEIELDDVTARGGVKSEVNATSVSV